MAQIGSAHASAEDAHRRHHYWSDRSDSNQLLCIDIAIPLTAMAQNGQGKIDIDRFRFERESSNGGM